MLLWQILALSLLSGMAALMEQVLWFHQAGLLFASTRIAWSATLAIFFVGLATGAGWAAWRWPAVERPLRLAAGLSALTGLWVVLGVLLYPLWDGFLHLGADTFGRSHLVSQVVVLSCWLGPATWAMGAGLPVIIQALRSPPAAVNRHVGFLYGSNTCGAAIGAGFAALWVLPAVGSHVGLIIAAGMDLLVAGMLWRLDKAQPAPGVATAVQEVAERQDSGADRRSVWWCCVCGFALGAVALSQEVLWERFLGLLIHRTVATAAATLMAVLLGVVIGSVLAACLPGRKHVRAFVLIVACAMVAFCSWALPTAPAAWWQDWAVGGVWALLLPLLLPAIASGMAFPLLISEVAQVTGVGRATAWVLAANTLGAVTGALLSGLVLIPYGGPALVVDWLALCALLALIALQLCLRGRLRLCALGVCALSVLLWTRCPWPQAQLPQDYLVHPGTSLLAYQPGDDAELAVLRRGEHKVLEIDRLWQGEDRRTHQTLAGHLPLLLHPEAQRVLVVGIGAGQTPAACLRHPIQALTAVDIEAAVIAMVREHFAADWLDDARVQLVATDGRQLLMRAQQQWDVIAIEVGQTFRPAVASFYSTDCYRQAAERLTSGGVLCQFVPVSMLSLEQFRRVVASFIAVFPNAVLFANGPEPVLIGRRGDEAQVQISAATVARLEDADIATDLAFSTWGGEAAYLHHPVNLAGAVLLDSKGLAAFAADATVYRHGAADLAAAVDPGADMSVQDLLPILRQHLSDPAASLAAGLALDPERMHRAQAGHLLDLEVGPLRARAAALRSRGQWAAALTVIEQARALHPENIPLALAWVDCVMQQGLHDREHLAACEQLLHDIVQRDPRSVTALINLGTLYRQYGRPDLASPLFHRALAVDPTAIEALINVGNDALAAGRTQEAITLFRRALARWPEHHIGRYSLAFALWIAEEPEDACRLWLQLLQEPDLSLQVAGAIAGRMRAHPAVHDALSETARTAFRQRQQASAVTDKEAWQALVQGLQVPP